MIFFNRNPIFYFPLVKNILWTFANESKRPEIKNISLILNKLKINVDKSQQLQKMLVNASMGEGKVTMSQDKARMQLNKLSPFISLYDQLNAVLKNISDLNQMKKQTSDAQQKKIIQQELLQLFKKQQQLKDQSINQLIPPDIYDDCQEVTLEFRAGAGGSQSCLFTQQFSSMIFTYAQSMGWKVQILSSNRDSSINKGYRSLNAKVMGTDVYKILKCQSGVHKVIRVPQTQAKGRIHSSTISMVVMPSVPFDFNVNQRDIKYEYMKASGPGGQSVNKTESACRATHLPTGLSVMNQEDRSQQRNRKKATQILKQRLFQIEYKKNVEQETKRRKSQLSTMDRSQKIRTYNYPQDRITDHRTGLTLFGMQSMMSGEYLQKFITSYQEKIYEQKLEMVLKELKKNQNQKE